eukprot:CAMPEP_0175865190 /NCGR_PEP_ID=MMETSP0107_2-20121207/33511_1 /TAXON_ID=195067 ORGANISM="Goniomonas pacifica, Strain CCMP1869" /NCGR_SAMPLE_ID=MMETSP0107_2 /ASSEMBLY_ACC=CAM_ASM_000203 /LENGTH=89 /DNA_ID=CAMNT_0017182569 /DNA_START=65 /DNA_END=334 /DNA_ORIENTATION=-
MSAMAMDDRTRFCGSSRLRVSDLGLGHSWSEDSGWARLVVTADISSTVSSTGSLVITSLGIALGSLDSVLEFGPDFARRRKYFWAWLAT